MFLSYNVLYLHLGMHSYGEPCASFWRSNETSSRSFAFSVCAAIRSCGCQPPLDEGLLAGWMGSGLFSSAFLLSSSSRSERMICSCRSICTWLGLGLALG